MTLGPEAAAAVVRGLGAYLRASTPTDLPHALRPLRNLRDQTLLARHLDELLKAFEDEAERALVGQWLEDGGPKKLTKADLAKLKTFLERPAGWEELLASRRKERAASAPKSDGGQAQVERERACTTKAREERDRARDRAQVAERQTADLERQLQASQTELERRIAELQDAKAKLSKATDDGARDRRKARRDLDKARSERDELKQRHRVELRELRAQLAEARKQKPATGKKTTRPTKAQLKEPKARSFLPVPLGRLEDDPKTLAEWLGTKAVLLLIDGYNVTKHKAGFGDLTLEAQRDRLFDLATGLARKFSIETTIVFDGSNIPRTSGSRKRSPVKVEYSRNGEIADDHLVALIEKLPPRPVIVVTNDKELQGRVRALKATVATSPQFLALARK